MCRRKNLDHKIKHSHFCFENVGLREGSFPWSFSVLVADIILVQCTMYTTQDKTQKRKNQLQLQDHKTVFCVPLEVLIIFLHSFAV